jgi:hypothetical protein
MAIGLLSVSAPSCAHAPHAQTPAIADDREAVAWAIVHTVGAAPKADVYILETDAAALGATLSSRVAELLGWRHDGHELFRPKAAEVRESRALITAGAPIWRTIERSGAPAFRFAKVPTSFKVGASPPVVCEVQVAPPTDEGGWSMRTPSDVPCWTKPQ